MDRIRRRTLRYRIMWVALTSAVLIPVYLGLLDLWGKSLDLYLAIFLVANIGFAIWQNIYTLSYWIQPMHREKVRAALKSLGFEPVISEGGRELFEKKLRFGRRSFAVVTDHQSYITLDVAERFERDLDQMITPDMLAGGRPPLRNTRLIRRAEKIPG